MGKTYSVYIKDDELVEEIDDAFESNEFHNQAHFWTAAAKELLDFDEDSEDNEFV